MKTERKLYEKLAKSMKRGELITLRCRADMTWKHPGYVVGLNEKFVVLNNAKEEIFLNGYTIFPLREIGKIRREPDGFIHRALQMDGFSPAAPNGIQLEDWPSLLASIDIHFPLTTLHLEHRHPDTCYIGRVAELKKRSVVLREISPAARWRKPRAPYRFDDITAIDFGGRYEAALWRVAQAEAETTDTL